MYTHDSPLQLHMTSNLLKSHYRITIYNRDLPTNNLNPGAGIAAQVQLILLMDQTLAPNLLHHSVGLPWRLAPLSFRELPLQLYNNSLHCWPLSSIICCAHQGGLNRLPHGTDVVGTSEPRICNRADVTSGNLLFNSKNDVALA